MVCKSGSILFLVIFHLGQFFLSPPSEVQNPKIWRYFQIRHNVTAPSSGEENADAQSGYKPFPIQQNYLYALMAKFISARDTTNKNTLLFRPIGGVWNLPPTTRHGDRGGRYSFWDFVTFSHPTYNFDARGPENLVENTPTWVKFHNFGTLEWTQHI